MEHMRPWTPVCIFCVLACVMPASAGSLPTLFAKAGPRFDITLKDSGGRDIKRLTAGTYRIVVTDRTGDDHHNFRIRGFGVNMATGIPFVGTQEWTVRFTRGKVYRFVCDPHAFVMHGSFKAV